MPELCGQKITPLLEMVVYAAAVMRLDDMPRERAIMPEPPDRKELGARADESYTYDFEKAQQILAAMDLLRDEAVKTNIEEVVAMIDANFRLLLTTYHCILRYEMTKLAGSEMVQ